MVYYSKFYLYWELYWEFIHYSQHCVKNLKISQKFTAVAVLFIFLYLSRFYLKKCVILLKKKEMECIKKFFLEITSINYIIKILFYCNHKLESAYNRQELSHLVPSNLIFCNCFSSQNVCCSFLHFKVFVQNVIIYYKIHLFLCNVDVIM